MNELVSSKLSDEARQVNKKIQYGVINTVVEIYKAKGRRELTFPGDLLCDGHLVHFLLRHRGEAVTQRGGIREGFQRGGAAYALTLNRQGG